jgi:hypothetical protein
VHIDHEVEFLGFVDRQIARLGALEDANNIAGRPTKMIGMFGP